MDQPTDARPPAEEAPQCDGSIEQRLDEVERENRDLRLALRMIKAAADAAVTSDDPPLTSAAAISSCPAAAGCSFFVPGAGQSEHDSLLEIESWGFEDFLNFLASVGDSDLSMRIDDLTAFVGQHNWKRPREVYEFMQAVERIAQGSILPDGSFKWSAR